MDRRERISLYLEGSPTKLRLLAALSKRAKNLTQLSTELGLTHSTVSQHVNELVEMGLVEKQPVGRRAFVALTDAGRKAGQPE